MLTSLQKDIQELQNHIEPVKTLSIILDAAHGSDVAGKRSPDGKFREYKWSRLIIRSLLEQLQNLGYKVYQTNTTDIEIGLTKRKNIASALGMPPRVLLSIHNNAAGMGDKWYNATGITFYTSKGQTKSDVFAECLYTIFSKDFPECRMRVDTTDADSDIESNFTVLMGNYIAVLAEILFQDSMKDVEKLNSPEFQNQVVKSFVTSIELFNSWYIKNQKLK